MLKWHPFSQRGTFLAVHPPTSWTIKCYACENCLMGVSISLEDGRLKLDSSRRGQSDFHKKFLQVTPRSQPTPVRSFYAQWEETLNRVWRHAARSAITESRHPHVVALKPLAGRILLMASRLARMTDDNEGQQRNILCAKHGLRFSCRPPLELIKEFARASQLSLSCVQHLFLSHGQLM